MDESPLLCLFLLFRWNWSSSIILPPEDDFSLDRSEIDGCWIRIKVFDAKNIVIANLKSSDPYLRFGFKGQKDSAVKTAVINNTLIPVWNHEIIIFSTDKKNDILQVDMFDENTEDFKLMNKIEIPLRDHPNKTHYIFNDDIAKKKKDAGQLHFELDFEPIE